MVQPSSPEGEEAPESSLKAESPRVEDIAEKAEAGARELLKEKPNPFPKVDVDALLASGNVAGQEFLNELYVIWGNGQSLKRSDLGEKDLVISEEDFEYLLFQLDVEEVSFIDKHGRRIRLRQGFVPEGEHLVILTSDLGDEEGKPFMQIVKD